MVYPIKSSARRTEFACGLPQRREGFTLAELMVSLAIMGLVLGGVYTAFNTMGKSAKVSVNHVEQSNELQYAFESILRSLRSVSEVHQTGSESFEFTTKNRDGSDERVRMYYDKDAAEFIRSSLTSGTAYPLIEDVTAVHFTYYDRFGEETSVQIDMNAAKLEITSERSGMSGDLAVNTETAMITFRNRTL